MRLLCQKIFQTLCPESWEGDLLLQWALTSALLILAVLLVRWGLGKHLSCRTRYALWAVVAVRLLLPVQLPISLPVAPSQLVGQVEGPFSEHRPNRNDPSIPIYDQAPKLPGEEVTGSSMIKDPLDGSVGQFIQHTGDGGKVVTEIPIWTRAQHHVFLWSTGAALMLLVLLVSNLRFTRRLKQRRRPLAEEASPIPVYMTEGLPAPCLFGLFRPAVYLTPEAASDETVRAHVLAHELTHYAHRDHIWAAMRCLALALHWYDPLVWLAAALSKRDGELACDEGAVARLGEEQRLPYGRTLVGLVAGRGSPADLLSCSTAMTGGKKTIQQRIALLVKKPETRKTALFAALALMALAVVFVFAGGKSIDSYEEFRQQVNAAQSIQYHGLPTTSYGYPAIADPDLLEQTRELLLQAEAYDRSESQVSFGFQDVAPYAHQLYLRQGTETRGYYLYRMENGPLYVLDLVDDTRAGAVPLAVLPGTALSQLRELAEQQGIQDAEQQQVQIRNPDDLTGVLNLLAADEKFLTENARLWGTTDAEVLRWLNGEGGSPKTDRLVLEHSDLDIPELQEVAPCWTVTCWSEGDPTYVFYLPDDLAQAVRGKLPTPVGATAIVTREVRVEEPGFLTFDGAGEAVVDRMDTYTAAVHDVAVVTEARGETVQVMLVYMDSAPICGTVPRDCLSFNEEEIRKTALNARMKGGMTFASVDGREGDTYSGIVLVEERRDGWARVVPGPGGQKAVWVRDSDLSYDFYGLWSSGAKETAEYEKFLDLTIRARSIPVARAGSYVIPGPQPITDAELLEQARELLSQAQWKGTFPEENYAQVWNAGYRFRLEPDPNDPTTGARYYFYQGGDGTWYVLNNQQDPIAVLPDGEIPNKLYQLGYQQVLRNGGELHDQSLPIDQDSALLWKEPV